MRRVLTLGWLVGAVACGGGSGSLPAQAAARAAVPSAKPTDRQPLDPYVQLSSGSGYSCGRRRSGRVFCWGANDTSQLGRGSSAFCSALPREVVGIESAVDISSGEAHACAALSGGLALCWGNQRWGKLGDGLARHQQCPRRADISGCSDTAVQVLDLFEVNKVAAGGGHSCALMRSGQVACWGDNAFGQLGSGDTKDSLAPRWLSGLDRVSALSLGSQHSCALRADGKVLCWGTNGAGQVGHAPTRCRVPHRNPHDGGRVSCSLKPTPVDLPGRAVQLQADGSSSCVLLESGQVACWGKIPGVKGSCSPKPVLLAGGGRVRRLGELGRLLCGDRQTTGPYCWGPVSLFGNARALACQKRDDCGESRGVAAGQLRPVSLSSGGAHLCALVRGRPVCWGEDGWGQLGLSNTPDYCGAAELRFEALPRAH